ncbi:hypothetical protein CDD82_2080 [Ophiocordyceps australis]|uniref:HECT-type E3 ubiquitin transferase n=1 Tax=Ophiocordyceps australis TaxID=1399860 RepID=A0A2C5YYZ4_9HYPO|nr:hypothetical protein CDD82_2080 [Ophiocordyceps australis]
MGKITKVIQARHKETMSPWLENFVLTASEAPLPSLPKQLASFPSRWPFSRGDLYHWIPLLNRFDSILEQLCKTYNLSQGPQPRAFGCDLLLNQCKDSIFHNEAAWNENQLMQMGYPPDGDRILAEATLEFTRMLLEHCGNRSIYASSAHLNDLLNSTSLPILISTLKVGVELAQRYQASVKRLAQNTSRLISTALLTNHYNIDLERVQQLAMPFVKTPIASLAATSMYANDLVAVATSDDKQWKEWEDVKVYYFPLDIPTAPMASSDPSRSTIPTIPTTPTPLRKASTAMGAQQLSTPKSRNIPADDSSPITPRTPVLTEDSVNPGQKLFEVPRSVVAALPLHQLVLRCPDDMPSASKYEAFNRLRVAKALGGSLESRRQVLAVRLLAISNLAYIHSDSNFVEKVLRHDSDETRRYQLVYQLSELIHPSTDNSIEVPLWLQSIGLSLLEAMSGIHSKAQDLSSALNTNVNHGILLYVIRKAVAGMASDADDQDDGDHTTELDEWRNSLFSLTLHLSMQPRVGSEMVSAGLMDALVETAFVIFLQANGLDAVSKLLVDTVADTQSWLTTSKPIGPEHRSSAVDYQIPYYKQQTLKWLTRFIHHIMTSAYSFSGNTDRLLRNLAEKSDLLGSLRDIIQAKERYGSVVWTNSVTILSDFINNDPANYAAIMESGMIKTFLEAVTNRSIPAHMADSKRDDSGDDEGSSDSSGISTLVGQDERPHPPSEDVLQNEERGPLAAGILASSDAINIVPHVLSSISLNNSGMKMVVLSRAIDAFFEVFESPAHVKCLDMECDLAQNIGNNFDEFARHHPPLRPCISNAVVDLVARLRFLGLEKSRTAGWGAKLFIASRDGSLLSVNESGELEDASNLSPQVREQAILGDADVDMSDVVAPDESRPSKQGNGESGAHMESITPYIHALANFLAAYLNNATLKMMFIRKGGIELLLDICESPSLPASFGESAASRVLNQVVSQLVEQSPVRALPSLLRRAQASVDVLGPLAAKTRNLPPYFAPFLAPDLGRSRNESETSAAVVTGTTLVKGLLNAQTFIKIIADCFVTTRSSGLSFYPVNVYDYYLTLMPAMAPLPHDPQNKSSPVRDSKIMKP